MSRNHLALSLILRRVSQFAGITLIVALALVPAWGQNPVPPTARQAGQMPQFAPRLHPAATPVPRAQASPRGPMWPQDNVIYENGPLNGTIDAWTINFGFAVSESFVPSGNGSFSGFDLWAWEFPGDKALTVDWSISSAPNGGTIYASGTVQVTDAFVSTNQFGYSIDKLSATGLSASLSGGTYYLNLQNAFTQGNNPLYWDENSGTGCHSTGCPSLAVESSLGTIPSETFDVVGNGPPPPPPCYTAQGNLKVLVDFTGQEDGSAPSGVVTDKAGNIYGATDGGGKYAAGLIYKLAHKTAGWIMDPLYSFAGGADGNNPSPVIHGPDGDLYGGAKDSAGNYSLLDRVKPAPVACLTALCSWTKDLLYQFSGGDDGFAGAVWAFDAEGNLYGTSATGGGGSCPNGCGTVFKLTPSAGMWSKTVLYSFIGGSDGSAPSEVLVGNDGNLYGLAGGGGANGQGVVFMLAPSAGGWTESVLHDFDWGNGGADPHNLIQDSSGNLYGIAQAYSPGLIFILSRSGDQWTFSELQIRHQGINFEYLNNLAMDPAGNIYGTGEGGVGCLAKDCPNKPANYFLAYVFKETRGSAGWQYQDLVFFDFEAFQSRGPLALDSIGNLYGATYGCGKYGHGTVWQVSP